MAIRYYSVQCKHGHHGANKFEPITFAIVANSAMEACDKARAMPGVKHSAMVLSCREITAGAYYVLRKESAYERSMLR